MIYRGFKIEQVIYHNNGTNGTPVQRIEYVIMETIAGFHWQEAATANDMAMAMEMIDRLVAVRNALSEEIGLAI